MLEEGREWLPAGEASDPTHLHPEPAHPPREEEALQYTPKSLGMLFRLGITVKLDPRAALAKAPL